MIMQYILGKFDDKSTCRLFIVHANSNYSLLFSIVSSQGFVWSFYSSTRQNDSFSYHLMHAGDTWFQPLSIDKGILTVDGY